MPEMHLTQPRFPCTTCRPFTKNKETGDSRDIYQNEINKACFQHDMAYGDFKFFPRIITSDKALRDKTFIIAKNWKYDGYKIGLTSKVSKCFGKNSIGGGIKSENMPDQQLVEQLHKRIIRKFEKQKLCSSFIDNIWGADFAGMQLINKSNKGIRSLLRAIGIFSK